MKERPILFAAPMVHAVWHDRKTVTRRIVKPQPDAFVRGVEYNPEPAPPLGTPYRKVKKEPKPNARIWEEADGTRYEAIKCPYGDEGDMLWVRETWRPNPFPTGSPYEYRATAEEDMTPVDGNWKPSLFMPRDACRLLLMVRWRHVERLQDITDEGALEEGVVGAVDLHTDEILYYVPGVPMPKFATAKEAFRFLWCLINGIDSWMQNPYVWVIHFRKINPAEVTTNQHSSKTVKLP